jgi:hypothetical protein
MGNSLLYTILKSNVMKQNSLFLFLIVQIILLSCNSSKEITFELDLIKKNTMTEDTTILVFRAKNHSDKDFVLMAFNIFSHILFVDKKGNNISDSIWDNYFYTFPIPNPPNSLSVFDEGFNEDIENYVESAIKKDFLSTQSLFKGSINNIHKKQIYELLKSKYQNLTLVGARKVYEVFFPFPSNVIDSLDCVILSYSFNKIVEGVDEIFILNIDEQEYFLKNLPLDVVDNYFIFKGEMEYELKLDPR